MKESKSSSSIEKLSQLGSERKLLLPDIISPDKKSVHIFADEMIVSDVTPEIKPPPI